MNTALFDACRQIPDKPNRIPIMAFSETVTVQRESIALEEQARAMLRLGQELSDALVMVLEPSDALAMILARDIPV